MAVLTRTRSELVLRALSVLGKLPAGQAAAAEDVELVDGYLDGMLDRLALQNVLYVVDPNEIPGAAYRDLAVLLAAEASTDFGLTVDELSSWTVTPADAEDSLKRMVRSRPTYEQHPVDYY